MSSRSTCRLLPAFLLSLAAAAGAPAQDPADSPQPTQLVVYDVGDLVRGVPVEGADDAARIGSERTAQVARIVATFLDPPLREHEESVKALGEGVMVALARPSQHQWIRGFLEVQRREMAILFLVECRIITCSSETAARLGLDQAILTLADREAVKDLERRLRDDEQADLLTAPRLLVYPLQQASISVANSISYVKEYTTRTIQPGDRTIVDPLVDVVQDGVVFEGVTASLQEKRIGLDFVLTVSSVQQPIPVRKTEHGEVGLPVTHTRSLASRLVLPPGGTVAVSGDLEDGKRVAMMVTVRKIAEGEKFSFDDE